MQATATSPTRAARTRNRRGRCSKNAVNRRARTRTVNRSLGCAQQVPRPPNGPDHRTPPGVDLLAQVRDIELHDVGLPAEVVVPHVVEYLRFAEHPAGVAHEIPQQLELGGGQLDVVVAAAYLVRVLVER